MNRTWGHYGGLTEPVVRRAMDARGERLKLEHQTLELAGRVKELERQVREKQSMTAEMVADADTRVSELLWQTEVLTARDGSIRSRLEKLQGEIVEKKRSVLKQMSSLPSDCRVAKKGASHFRLSPRDEAGLPVKPKETGSSNGSAQLQVAKLPNVDSHSPRGIRPPNWRENLEKREDARRDKWWKLHDRSEEIRDGIKRGAEHDQEMRHTTDLGPISKDNLPWPTREAWLRAHAENKNEELEKRLQDKEAELRELEAGILKRKALKKEQAKLDKWRQQEMGDVDRPLHREERRRQKKRIAGTRECEYLQQALHCISAPATIPE